MANKDFLNRAQSIDDIQQNLLKFTCFSLKLSFIYILKHKIIFKILLQEYI